MGHYTRKVAMFNDSYNSQYHNIIFGTQKINLLYILKIKSLICTNVFLP